MQEIYKWCGFMFKANEENICIEILSISVNYQVK